MKQFLIILVMFFSFFSEKRTPGVSLFLEDSSGTETVAFQQTGEQGKASFGFLDGGNYRLLVEFPQQNGKWVKEKRRHSILTKAAYNSRKNTYYYQGKEGYFSIKFSGLKKIDQENFRPVFREVRLEEDIQINVLQFQALKKGGQINISVRTLTAAQFKKKVEKAENDISMLSIPGIK